jgi:lysophospholipase L1-like esterase
VVAAIGDSLTDERVGGGGYLKILRARCPESTFDGYGVGGQMLNQMRRRFVLEVFARGKPRYTHVIVFGGVNDLYSDLSAGRSLADITADLSAMYGEARARGAQVVAVSVTPWGGFMRYFNARRSQATSSLNRWIFAQVEGNVLAFALDAYTLLSCGDPERLCPELAHPHKDGLHFGPRGHEALAAALQRQVFANCR